MSLLPSTGALHHALCPLCRTPFEADVNLCPNLDLGDAIERKQAAGQQLQRFFMAPEYWTTLREWFPDASLVFTQLGRVLCVPDKRSMGINLADNVQDNVQVGIQEALFGKVLVAGQVPVARSSTHLRHMHRLHHP